MTKATFKGVEGAEKSITCMGMHFVTGVPREVPDRFLDKLQGHSHFLVEGRPYKLATPASQPDDLNPPEAEDEVEGSEREYTAAELTKVLADAKVTIPKEAKGNAQALYDLIVANNLPLSE